MRFNYIIVKNLMLQTIKNEIKYNPSFKFSKAIYYKKVLTYKSYFNYY